MWEPSFSFDLLSLCLMTTGNNDSQLPSVGDLCLVYLHPFPIPAHSASDFSRVRVVVVERRVKSKRGNSGHFLHWLYSAWPSRCWNWSCGGSLERWEVDGLRRMVKSFIYHCRDPMAEYHRITGKYSVLIDDPYQKSLWNSTKLFKIIQAAVIVHYC